MEQPRRHHQFAVAWLAILCCALALANASSPISPSDRLPDCQLSISGDQDGNITAASMQCASGAHPDLALDHVLQGGLQAGFQNSDANSSCQAKAKCLVTLCSGLLVLKNSSISGVRSGALESLICVLGSSKLEVHNSQFVQNTARPFACIGQVQLILSGSNISHNMVRNGSGGGLWAEGSTVLITDGSHVNHNSASGFGGGLFAEGDASVTITRSSSVHHNVAQKDAGGGVFIKENASLSIHVGSHVHNNMANGTGGGVAAWNSSIVVTDYSSVHGNVAQHYAGGGIVAQGNSSVIVNNGSSVRSNAALGDSGGGVSLWGSASLRLAGGSSVHNNTALWSGGGVGALEDATVKLSGGSSVHSNVAQLQSGGGMVVMGDAKVLLTGRSSVHSNKALNSTGGGLVAFYHAQVMLSNGSSVSNNIALYSGGGIVVVGGADLAIANSSYVQGNRAVNGNGGGLLITSSGRAKLSGGCRIVGNKCDKGVGGGIAVGVPELEIPFGDKGLRRGDEGSGSATAKWSNASARISGCIIGNNTSFLSAGGGVAVAKNGTVVLTGNTQVVGNRAVNGSGGGAVVIDRGTLQLGTGVSFTDNVVNRGYVGSTIAAFDNCKLRLPPRGSLTKCSTGVYLGRTPCEEGETLLYDVCTCCPRHTYSFDNTSLCEPCPPNGVCEGGNLVEPSAGYWQSSNMSVEMHRCPLFTTSCNHTAMPLTGTIQTCNQGYQGNLCGACQLPKYGLVSPLKCRKCMSPRVQLGLYILACCATVVFVALTVHATWRENLQGGQSVNATDYIKVLVQFLQYVVIIGNVQFPWPAALDVQRWFQVASSVFGASSGQALSLDCWLFHYVQDIALHLATQRQLVYFLAPVGVFLGVVALQLFTWVVRRCMVPLPCTRRRLPGLGGLPAEGVGGQGVSVVLRRLPVAALVVAYYAYPTLLRASLGFFACLHIDTMKATPGGPVTLNHLYGYWVNDIQQACFAGYHLGWALGMGLPSVLLWYVAVPVTLGVGLKLSQSKAEEPSFREHFGFLYRNYRPERMWWEAVWAGRTVVLTLVSVFSFPMERYFSVLALLLVFWASAVLQAAFKPFAHPSQNAYGLNVLPSSHNPGGPCHVCV